jgi:hypothetical protein
MIQYKYFYEFYHKMFGLNNYADVTYLYNNTHIPNEFEQKLVDSLISQERYKKKIPTDKFMVCLDTVSNIKFKEDAALLFEEITELTEDKSQLNAIKRIIAKKPHSYNKNVQHLHKPVMVVKECPYCGRNKTDLSTADYVICGYTNRGFDWEGCGHDWCFQCGRKLCKCFNQNQLFLKMNQYHDDRCCKLHSQKTEGGYPEDYCQCGANTHVNRSLNLY